MKIDTNTILLLAIGAYLVYQARKKDGDVSGLASFSAEPNFPTTAVAGIGARGWTVYSQPVSTNFLRRVVLTT